MGCRTIRVGDDFWNFRGSFRIGGVIDVGTHASLVRRANGAFVFLDSCTLTGAARREVDELTRGGQDVEAILNVHPFHTVHVEWMHEQFPQARLYGTARHLTCLPDLPWQPGLIEEPATQEQFGADFAFSVPAGVDFVSADGNVHFSSVLVKHQASRTLHVDDTIVYLRLPAALRLLGLGDRVSFHPTLAKALEKRPGAARDFRRWAERLIAGWGESQNLCAAHTATLLGRDNRGPSLADRLTSALRRVRGTLENHERRYG